MAEEHRSPEKAMWPDPNKVKCKDCFLRDKTEVNIGTRVIKAGVTKAFCAAYPPPPDSNGKPREILFQNANCKYYQSEKKAIK